MRTLALIGNDLSSTKLLTKYDSVKENPIYFNRLDDFVALLRRRLRDSIERRVFQRYVTLEQQRTFSFF